MTIHRPGNGNIVPFKPDAGAAAVDSADTLAKRTKTALDNFERRLAIVEAPAAPLGTWRR